MRVPPVVPLVEEHDAERREEETAEEEEDAGRPREHFTRATANSCALLSGLAAFGVYMSTLSPSIGGADSGELITFGVCACMLTDCTDSYSML